MELLITGGWFVYCFRINHGRTIKVGMPCEIKRNKDGVIIARVMLKRRRRVTMVMKDGKIKDHWSRVEEPTVFPIQGNWYVERLDPKSWKKGRRAL